MTVRRSSRDEALLLRSFEWTPSVFDAVMLEPIKSLSPATKLVWCFLALQGRPVFAGDRMLSDRLGLARKVISDAVMRLETLGLLEIVDPGPGSRPRVVRALEPQVVGTEVDLPTAEGNAADGRDHGTARKS